jgi:hypothetical protein
MNSKLFTRAVRRGAAQMLKEFGVPLRRAVRMVTDVAEGRATPLITAAVLSAVIRDESLPASKRLDASEQLAIAEGDFPDE